MKHILFHPNSNNQYEIAILVKDKAFASQNIEKNYITPLIKRGVTPDSMLALSLKFNEFGKAPAKLIKEHLQTVLKACVQLHINTLVVTDTAYFKTLTKVRKAEPHFGYILPCKIKDFEHINIILSVNYQSLFYNPTLQTKLDMSLDTVKNHIQGTHIDLGTDIIKHAEYPRRTHEIQAMLVKLLEYPELTCDIETASLDLSTAGVATITFCWNQHEGCAFAVDRGHTDEVYDFLRTFFIQYKGKLIYHRGTFDIKMLIYKLFMNDPLDVKGLIDGLEVMYKNVDDTLLITYLATNTTAGNVLGLKENAFEYTGNYAQDDIKDTSLIPLPELLEYNLIDGLATWYVYNKNYPIMIQDNQLDIYNEIFIPSMKVITHMELTGMPMNTQTIKNTTLTLTLIRDANTFELQRSQLVKDWCWKMQREAFIMKNLILKTKINPIEDFAKPFNPASNKQVQNILYDYCALEVIDKTDTGLPAVGGDTLKKLLNKLVLEHNITDEELE